MLYCYQGEHLELSHFRLCSEHRCCKLKAKYHYEDEDVFERLILFVLNNIPSGLHHSERLAGCVQYNLEFQIIPLYIRTNRNSS